MQNAKLKMKNGRREDLIPIPPFAFLILHFAFLSRSTLSEISTSNEPLQARQCYNPGIFKSDRAGLSASIFFSTPGRLV
jgi:hypothetical protein